MILKTTFAQIPEEEKLLNEGGFLNPKQEGDRVRQRNFDIFATIFDEIEDREQPRFGGFETWVNEFNGMLPTDYSRRAKAH